ncbi:MAG: SGNH/GDSL hydrolase family protein [Mycobacteriaceae bacterium]|nr:SGNH/GDSL hydrolase family protein [Mycobacteriaceae bacterium]MBV9638265.1 SGNH/GDSL hydrolase family protein [Mycobacteriaceae bacterium]
MVSVPAAAAPVGPLRIAVFGDSIIWGQGLPNDQKMWYLFGQDLQSATGRHVEVSNYSHSGAPLSYPHPGTTDVFPGNCADGDAAPGEVPDPTTAVIDCQIPQAVASGQKFDLVLLNGCINDLGVLPPMNPQDYRSSTNLATGTAAVAESVSRYCTPELSTALRQAHALPGNPKVALLGYYPYISQESLNSIGVDLSGTVVGSAKNRCEEFSEVFDKIGNDVTRQAGPWATYVNSGITGASALLTSEAQVFNGIDDPLFSQRMQECAPYGDYFYGACPVASAGHPNADGDDTYRKSLDNSSPMQAWVKEWSTSRP